MKYICFRTALPNARSYYILFIHMLAEVPLYVGDAYPAEDAHAWNRWYKLAHFTSVDCMLRES